MLILAEQTVTVRLRLKQLVGFVGNTFQPLMICLNITHFFKQFKGVIFVFIINVL